MTFSSVFNCDSPLLSVTLIRWNSILYSCIFSLAQAKAWAISLWWCSSRYIPFFVQCQHQPWVLAERKGSLQTDRHTCILDPRHLVHTATFEWTCTLTSRPFRSGKATEIDLCACLDILKHFLFSRNVCQFNHRKSGLLFLGDTSTCLVPNFRASL